MSIAGSTAGCCCTHALRRTASASASASSRRTAGIAASSTAARHASTSAPAASSASASTSTSTSSSTSESRPSPTARRGAGGRAADSVGSGSSPRSGQHMIPIRPDPVMWDHELAINVFSTPAPAAPPRVPLNLLTAFDSATPDALPPDAKTAASTPTPLIVGAKHTLKHAVRSNQLHLGSGIRNLPIPLNDLEKAARRASARVPSIGYEPRPSQPLTGYKGFSRAAEIRAQASSADASKRQDANAAILQHGAAEALAGDYSDHVAQGPLLARLLRGIEADPKARAELDSKAVEDIAAGAHDAVRVADQALALNPSLDQTAKQFILHAIKDRVDPPAAPEPAPAPSASSGAADGKKGTKAGKQQKK